MNLREHGVKRLQKLLCRICVGQQLLRWWLGEAREGVEQEL